MSLAKSLAMVGQKRRRSDLLFSVSLWTGNAAARTISANFGLSGKEGIVWIKSRSTGDHKIFDTLRGATKSLSSNLTSAESTDAETLTAFGTAGFDLGTATSVNNSGTNYLGFSFAAKPKFLDVVTYAGNNTAGRTIPHNLGCDVGLIIVRRLGLTTDWICWWAGMAGNEHQKLNLSDAVATSSAFWNDTAPTSTHFTVGAGASVNGTGSNYVAYIFANDTGANSIIKAGTYTGTGAAGNQINLGFTNGVRFLLVKRKGTAGSWHMLNSTRGYSGSFDPYVVAEATSAEITATNMLTSYAQGFEPTGTALNNSGSTYSYLAIAQ